MTVSLKIQHKRNAGRLKTSASIQNIGAATSACASSDLLGASINTPLSKGSNKRQSRAATSVFFVNVQEQFAAEQVF
jgi:hypothetical protein